MNFKAQVCKKLPTCPHIFCPRGFFRDEDVHMNSHMNQTRQPPPGARAQSPDLAEIVSRLAKVESKLVQIDAKMAQMETKISSADNRAATAEARSKIAETRAQSAEEKSSNNALIAADQTKKIAAATCAQAAVEIHKRVMASVRTDIETHVMPEIRKTAEWVAYQTQDDADVVRGYRERVFSDHVGSDLKMLTSGTNNDKVIAPHVYKFYGEDEY